MIRNKKKSEKETQLHDLCNQLLLVSFPEILTTKSVHDER